MTVKTHDLAAWVRQEHEKVRELSDSLQEKVAVVPSTNQARWIREVREHFDHFRSHFVKHMALEEQDGYMLPVLERRPALSREVDRLAHEHAELIRIMDAIHRALHELRPHDNLLIIDACRHIRQLLLYVEHHEKDENLLLLSAYTEDLGTKD